MSTVERFNFNKIVQKEAETFDQFVARLRQQAKFCDFGDLKNALISDRIVVGVRDESLRERLLRKTDLKLDKAIEFGRAAELIQKQTAELKELPATVDRITKNRGNSTKPQCTRCGYRHADRPCPAQGKRCRRCDRPNHFASCCKQAPKTRDSKPVHVVGEEEEFSDVDGDELQFDSIQIDPD